MRGMDGVQGIVEARDLVSVENKENIKTFRG